MKISLIPIILLIHAIAVLCHVIKTRKENNKGKD